MSEAITSTKIKAGLFNYFRTKKQFDCCATECGDFNADFLAVNKKNELMEIEVKISISDLKADFKKKKHSFYKEQDKSFTPKYFYYCVPDFLVQECKQLLEKNGFDNYGIFMFKEDRGFRHLLDSIYQMKTAKKLHDRKINTYEQTEIMRRMTSDLQRRYNTLVTITPSKKMAKDYKILCKALKYSEKLIEQYQWCDTRRKNNCEDCIFNKSCIREREIERLTGWLKESLLEVKTK